MAVESKHVSVFRTKHLRPNETITASCGGYIGQMMGSGKNTQHNGALIVTGERAVFYRKGFFGEVLETMPLDKITSIERKTMLGHKTVRLHTSHDQLEFKTHEAWEAILAALENRGGSVPVPVPVHARSDFHADRLTKLVSLRDAGLITADEFAAKRADILSQV